MANPKTNLQFYLHNQAYFNPEHIEASYKAFDALPEGTKRGLEAVDIYRENYYLTYDKANPDRTKNAPARQPGFKKQMAKLAAKNQVSMQQFWEKLKSDNPWGGHERKSGDIKTHFGKVTYILEEDLPEIFHRKIMGQDVVNHYAWDESPSYFYARDEAGRPFKQIIVPVEIVDR